MVKKYLTDEEGENLKAACKTPDDRDIVRDLLETGSTLRLVRKNKRERADIERYT